MRKFYPTWLCPWKFQTKQIPTPGNSTNFSEIPWTFKRQKPRPLEIPQYFFLVTLGNSTLLLINRWKFHVLFLWYLWKFHILNPPPSTVQGFPYLGEWGWSPLYQQKICSFSPVDSPHQIISPPPKVDPPTKQQFSRYNPIKTRFLAVVIVPAPFLF